MTIVTNEKNELIAMQIVTGWQICMDYCMLNTTTKKNHFSLPFINLILGMLNYFPFQMIILGITRSQQHMKDQNTMKFTCTYGSLAFLHMRFRLYNTLGMFKWCMTTLFVDFVEKLMKIFMDDFSVFENSKTMTFWRTQVGRFAGKTQGTHF